MSGETTVAAATGLFKTVYGTKLNDVRPVSSVIQDRWAFLGAKRVGATYNEGVLLQMPNGASYLGSAGGVSALNAAANAVSKQTSITPSELVMREQMAYAAMARAVSEGEAAFKSLTSETIVGMKSAHHNRVEASLLHGQRGYGTVASVAASGSNGAVTFTDATWAPGMWWAFGVGSRWDSFTGSTKNNATGVLTVVSISASSKTVVFSYTGTLGSEVAAGDILYPQGAYDGTTHSDMLGLMSQAGNTGSMFGIDAATYSNWLGNTADFAGVATYSKFEAEFGNLRDRGADGTLVAFLPNKTFSQLAVELANLRIIGATSQGKQGFKTLSYDSADVGAVELVKHPFMMQGEALVVPSSAILRSGSTDVTMGIPGNASTGDVFMYVPGSNAVEIQSFSDQFVLDRKPNHSLVITGITG